MTTPLSLRSKIFLIAFGLVMALICFEGALAILSFTRKGTEFSSINDLRNEMSEVGNEKGESGSLTLKGIINPHDDDHIIYDLKPNLSVQFQGVPVITNSCGMRSPERPIKKPRDTYRIAMLGDSFAFGWGVEQKKIFAQVLEDNLNRHFKGKPKVEVFNFGVPGYSTFQEVYQFLDKGSDFNPDAIIVFFIQNDFGPPFFIRNFGNQGIIASSYIAQLAMKALDPKAEEHALLRSGLDPNRSLNILADYAKEHGIELFLAINPKRDWRSILHSLFVTKSRKDIHVMNLRDNFMRIVRLKHLDDKDLTLPTDPHPSALRHKIYGDIMTPYLLSVIP